MATIQFDEQNIKEFEKLFRNNFINSLSGFKSANLIGSVDKLGVNNLAVFSSVVHLGSNPPLLGMVLRPTTVTRNTYDNLKKSGYYSINHINEEIISKAHQTSAKYPSEVDEFQEVQLTPHYSKLHPAPYVQEANIKMGMKFEKELPLEINGTIFIIGRIIEVILEEGYVTNDGFVDLHEANTVMVNGLDGYLKSYKISRYSYARPNQMPTKLDR